MRVPGSFFPFPPEIDEESYGVALVQQVDFSPSRTKKLKPALILFLILVKSKPSREPNHGDCVFIALTGPALLDDGSYDK